MYFDEKVDYLSQRAGKLDARYAVPLKRLHKYRNEAHHRAKIRRGTIATATRILLEIVCEMLVSSGIGYTHASDGDYSWLRERFGADATAFFGNRQNTVKEAVNDIRNNLSLDDASMANALSQYLVDRLNDALDDITFLINNTRFKSAAEVLSFSEFRQKSNATTNLTQKTYEDFQSTRRPENLEYFRNQALEVVKIENRICAFERFSQIEEGMEPLLNELRVFAREVSAYLEMEEERLRGK